MGKQESASKNERGAEALPTPDPRVSFKASDLTAEEMRRLVGVFRILLEWDEEDRRKRAVKPDAGEGADPTVGPNTIPTSKRRQRKGCQSLLG